MDMYVVEAVPREPEGLSVVKRRTALFMVSRSDNLLLSLACFRSSAGLSARITTTERTAIIAMTTNNSMRVNPAPFEDLRRERGAPVRKRCGVKDFLLSFPKDPEPPALLKQNSEILSINVIGLSGGIRNRSCGNPKIVEGEAREDLVTILHRSVQNGNKGEFADPRFISPASIRPIIWVF